jgi:hypothetical protein
MIDRGVAGDEESAYPRDSALGVIWVWFVESCSSDDLEEPRNLRALDNSS